METDDLLVRRVLAGDKPAFEELVDRHRAEAVRLARRLLHRPADAEDAVQEAFLHAFLNLGRLRSPERFRGWLLGIVLNLARSRWRTRPDYPLEAWTGGRMVAGPLVLDTEPSPEVAHESRELHRLVIDAIATLSEGQRETVELHYVEGLKLWEIAALAEVPIGTIKARLHRARERLRHVPTETFTARRALDAAEEELMIEVTVEDVIVRSPKAEPGTWLAAPKENTLGYWRIVLLKERAGDRVLPIWLHPHDGDWIAMRLVGLEFFRPVPHDLIARLLPIGDLHVEKVAVTGLREDTFYGSIWIRAGSGAVHEIDARPSDAIAMALEFGAPIFVVEETLRQAGVKVLTAGRELPELEDFRRQSIAEGKAEPEPLEMEWRSFRSLPRNESKWLRLRTSRATAK